MTRSQAKSENIVGVLPGSDPQLKKEYVVVSAHLDHLGIGEPVNGDRIYNGAMDDASGDASLIEIARAMKDAKPKRSILFLSVTGGGEGRARFSVFCRASYRVRAHRRRHQHGYVPSTVSLEVS